MFVATSVTAPCGLVDSGWLFLLPGGSRVDKVNRQAAERA